MYNKHNVTFSCAGLHGAALLWTECPRLAVGTGRKFMNEKALRTLEYTKIIDLLTAKATSEPGRALCRDLKPFDNLSDITIAQQETSDALSMLFAKGSTSFGGNRDVSYSLRSLEIGSSLSASELLKIAGLLDNVSRIKAYGKGARGEEAETSLTGYFQTLGSL